MALRPLSARLLTTVSLLCLAAPLHAQEIDLPFELETVTVAGRGEQTVLSAPAAVSVVGADEIARRQPSTFEELLGDAPGVEIGGGPRGIAQEPNIRGFQDEQVVIRIDGARQNFNVAHRGRFFVDPDIIDRVEVVRGGASALYGSGALGGVIAIETKDVDDLLDPGDPFGARLHGSYASNGGELFGSGTVYGRIGRADGLLFLGWREMGDDLEDGDGDEIVASELDARNVLLKLGVEPVEDLRLETNLQYYEDDGTVPVNANAAAGATNRVVDRDVEVGSYRLGIEYAPLGSDLIDLDGVIYYNTNDVEEDRVADGRLDTTEYRTLGIDLANRSSFDMGVPVRLTYGVEGYRDEQTGTRNGADRTQFPDAEATYLAAFAQADIDITDRFTLTPGLRYDRYDLDPDDFSDRTEDQLSPRVAVSFDVTDALTLFGSASQSFRAPSLTELYNDGTHFAIPGGFPVTFLPFLPTTPTFSGVNEFIPNPDLKPEEATQFEAGAKFEDYGILRPGDRLSASVSGYYSDVDDYIDSYVNFIDPATYTGPFVNTIGGSTRTRNIDAKLWGFEAELDYDADFWFAGLSLTLPQGKSDEGGDIGSLPQDRLSLTLGVRPLADVEVGARATFRSGETAQVVTPSDTSTNETPGSTVIDLFASYAPEDGPLAGARFAAGIDNVLDKTYRIHPNGLNQAGRSVKLSASWSF